MALRVLYGFEDRSPWGRPDLSYNQPALFVAGRNGGVAIRGDGMRLYAPLPSSASRVCISAALRRTANNRADGMFALADSGVALNMTDTGVLFVTGDNFNPQYTGYALPLNEWARVDWIVQPSTRNAQNQDTIGHTEVWVNGIQLGSWDSKLGQGDRHLITAQIYLGNGFGTLEIDDLYITDESGPAPFNGRLGDVRIESLLPSGNGSVSNAVGTDGNNVDNYQLVDEIPASATDNVVAAALGDRDLYQMSDPQLVGQVLAVRPVYHAAKTDGGAASLIPVVKTGGDEVKGTALGLNTTEGYVNGPVLTQAPDGGAWTTSKLAATELGFEVGP